MFSLALSTALLLAQSPSRDAAAKIVLASMFKNGYAVIVREMDVAGSGEYVLKKIPQASLGTLWLTTSPDAKLTSVINTETETTSSVPAASVADLLALNIGKKVALIFGDPAQPIMGVLKVVTGNLVILTTEGGDVAVERASIRRVIAQDGLTTSTTVKGAERGLRFQVQSSGAGKVYMLSLERGMAWAPGYAVTLKSGGKLEIVGKATAINDLDDLNGIEARFVTGFPNMPFASVPDPLTMNGGLDQFLGIIGGVGGPSYRDSGAGGRAGEMMRNQAPAAMSADFGGAMDPSQLGGIQAEDLFFYRQPNVTLKKGDRAYYVLFTAESPYEEIYTWDIDDFVQDASYRPIQPSQVSEDVWHIVRFTNTAKQPFSTGAATIFRNDQMIGQDMMRYASVGGKAELRITKAMDVSADQLEEEVSRERGVLKDRYNNATHDLVTLKGTLTVVNRKSDTVNLRVRKQVTGEIVSTTPEAKVTKVARGLRDVNTRSLVEFNQKVEPGKTLTMTYTYKVYIRV